MALLRTEINHLLTGMALQVPNLSSTFHMAGNHQTTDRSRSPKILGNSPTCFPTKNETTSAWGAQKGCLNIGGLKKMSNTNLYHIHLVIKFHHNSYCLKNIHHQKKEWSPLLFFDNQLFIKQVLFASRNINQNSSNKIYFIKNSSTKMYPSCKLT